MRAEATQAIEVARQMRPQLKQMVLDERFLKRYRDSMVLAMVDVALRMTGADMASIQLVDPASEVLRVRAERGFNQPFLEFFDCVHDRQAGGTAFKSHREPDLSWHACVRSGARCRNAVQSTPLVGRSGAILGVLSTDRRAPGRPSDGDLFLLDPLGQIAAEWVELRMHLKPAPQRVSNGVGRQAE